jgi:hypothetical protein
MFYYGLIPGQYAQANDFHQATVTINEIEKKPAHIGGRTWCEIRGSLNRSPVYLIVQKAGQQQVTGYLFDKAGGKRYIYGEWYNNELQLYDTSKKRLNVILPK